MALKGDLGREASGRWAHVLPEGEERWKETQLTGEGADTAAGQVTVQCWNGTAAGWGPGGRQPRGLASSSPPASLAHWAVTSLWGSAYMPVTLTCALRRGHSSTSSAACVPHCPLFLPSSMCPNLFCPEAPHRMQPSERVFLTIPHCK